MTPGYDPSVLKCVSTSNTYVFIHPPRLSTTPSSCPTVQAASLYVLSTVSITETSRFLRTDPAQQILEQNVRDSSIASQSSTSHSGSINNGEPEIFMGFFIASLILTNISVLFATTILQYVRHLLHS